MIGASASMQILRTRITQVARTAETVLIAGESGTGKELVARAIHAASARAAAPLVSLNCPVLSAHLMESELFGHVKGAFTGASQARRGLLEFAGGGTIFLDEVGDMPPSMQVKLLRVLQERCVRPLGCTRENPIDVRILAATHRNLPQEISAGNFREDLYYRLSVVPLSVPPLREHPEDISILAAAAHLLLAENEQSTSACVGLLSLSRPDSHSSASINGAHPVPCSRQLVSNCDASNTSSTAHAPLLSTAHLWEEKERIQQAPKSQIIEAALQILA